MPGIAKRGIGLERFVELAVVEVLFAVEIDHVADMIEKGWLAVRCVAGDQLGHLDLIGPQSLVVGSPAVADDVERNALAAAV